MSFKVNDSIRKKNRDLKSALGNDIIRYIVEILTNADDSYKRLGENVTGPIYINFSEEKRGKYKQGDNYVIQIIDNAEGMTSESLMRIFTEYGGDNANGDSSKARGIFGQGASDVLRAAASENRTATIETIKNNVVSKLKYNMSINYEPTIDVEEVSIRSNDLKSYREKMKIPQNGTSVSFGIPSNVKINQKIRKDIPNLLSKNPYLRFLLCNPNRTIIYTDGEFSCILSSNNYQLDKENLLATKNFNFKFEDKKIQCVLNVYHKQSSDDSTLILCRDENFVVYDNTMFDFSRDIKAQSISGELIINNLYSLCKEHLNRDDADAIILDNRTGFDSKNPFYKSLLSALSPILSSILAEHVKDTKSVRISADKKFNDALKSLNKYIKDELKEDITSSDGPLSSTLPPQNGIQFARNFATITKGKKYNLKLYINPSIISPRDIIRISVEDNNYIYVSPLDITFSEEEGDFPIVVKNITIESVECTPAPILIEAKVGSITTATSVQVIDSDIHYPENGFEFYPNDLSLVYDKIHIAKLYIDSNLFPIGSNISYKCDGLELVSSSMVFSEENIIGDSIGSVDVALTGGNLDSTYTLIAECNGVSAKAKITLIPSNSTSHSGSGMISDIILEENEGAYHQAYYNPHTKCIVINISNPINKAIMGDLSNVSPTKPSFTKDQKKYLCDIIAYQASIVIVKNKNLKNGDIVMENHEDAMEQILNLIQENKNIIYELFHKALSE